MRKSLIFGQRGVPSRNVCCLSSQFLADGAKYRANITVDLGHVLNL